MRGEARRLPHAAERLTTYVIAGLWKLRVAQLESSATQMCRKVNCGLGREKLTGEIFEEENRNLQANALSGSCKEKNHARWSKCLNGLKKTRSLSPRPSDACRWLLEKPPLGGRERSLSR